MRQLCPEPRPPKACGQLNPQHADGDTEECKAWSRMEKQFMLQYPASSLNSHQFSNFRLPFTTLIPVALD